MTPGRIRRAFAVLLLSAGLLVAVNAAAPTAAQAGIACPANAVCTYEHKGYGGAMYYYTPFYTCIQVGGWWKDNISSVVNMKDQLRVKLYYNSTCTGNLWNQVIEPRHSLYLCPELLNDHVWSLYIGFDLP